jgi:hypothetical protein
MDRLQVRQQIWGALCGVARPDNGLERQRAQALRDGKVALVTTYGIRRGAAEVRPEYVPPGSEAYFSTLVVK